MPPLSILLWLPAACALLGARCRARPPRGRAAAIAAGRPASRRRVAAEHLGRLALLGSLARWGWRSATSPTTRRARAACTHVTDVVWISELGIHYKLGVDGLNVFLVGLTTLLFAAAAIAANLREWERPRLFYFHFMLAESAVLGAFLAQDLALFVAFFDLMLIPFYFLIGHVGPAEPERVRATIKLVIYTLVGSLLMLAAAVATGVLAAQQGGGHITFVLSLAAGTCR